MNSPSTSSNINYKPVSTNGSSIRTSRCPQCSPRSKENLKGPVRNLIVCIDGTSNQFGQNNTNVVKLFAKINLESTNPEQRAYYSSGIGTRPKSLHIIDRMERAVSDKFDMAVAWNMEEIVKDAYGWLARTYQEGDRIYLFGFSRGAYQVRVLAGMIHEVGLIRTPTEKQIGTAYDHYDAMSSGKPKTRQIAREFKNTFSWKDLKVHFVGVWDTVSSVGLIRGDVFLSTSSSAAHACQFRHALALDELRVKFMPEYFHEMNQADDSDDNSDTSRYIVTPNAERRASTASENTTSEGKIKEVWFAGCHSDVGGKNRPGKPQQAGNVSLLWMRREATEQGLVLEPTDVVWVPDDLDFGTSNSMSRIWSMIECFPIKHQVSFSGAGENARRWHLWQPRRIIPGQKVHASVLYANAYKPSATLGEGFDLPIVQTKLEATELDEQIWETGFFDDTAARELLDYLGSQQGVAPIYLDRLLFMLRFKEGKECVRKVPGWQDMFMKLIEEGNCAPLVRLVTIVAFHEASCDLEAHPDTCEPFPERLSHDIFVEAEACLKAILGTKKHRDGPRVVALLRPLTKHQIFRQHILTDQVLQTLMTLLDATIKQPTGNFGQAMDGLKCLLQCEGTQNFIIEKLAEIPGGFDASRLAEILEVDNSRLLTAALRMMFTLARIPNARAVCSPVMPKIRQLASKRDRLVGQLAIEIWLALYDGNEQNSLNIQDANVRANVASVLVRVNVDRRGSADVQGRTVDPGQVILSRLFGLDAVELNGDQIRLIGELRKAVERGNARERTAATLTLLKLCETPAIRTHLRGTGLLNVFVKQLRRKDSALLAAYALATCLNFADMQEPIQNINDLPKNIVGMLRLDYFDDAVGQVEGFQIFGDIMHHDDLRKKIEAYKITDVLNAKLGKGKPKEIRTSLICLDIFRSYEPGGTWTRDLVDRSMERLGNQSWKVQKAGVTILSALAQTKHGVAAIDPEIEKIVGMLLPLGYLPITPTTRLPPQGSQISPGKRQSPVVDPLEPPPDAPPRPPSWMLGPACALRILAQNETLRIRTHETIQYGSLKHLYLSGALVDEKDTSAWRVWTPNRHDVITMLDKMIKTVDKELSEEGLMAIGDAVLPHIAHWDRLSTMLRDGSVAVITALPVVLGVSVLAILGVALATPVYVSVQAVSFLRRRVSRYLDGRVLEGLRDTVVQPILGDHSAVSHPEVGTAVPQTIEDLPSEHEDEVSQSDGITPPQGGSGQPRRQPSASGSSQDVDVRVTPAQGNGKGKQRQPLLERPELTAGQA